MRAIVGGVFVRGTLIGGEVVGLRRSYSPPLVLGECRRSVVVGAPAALYRLLGQVGDASDVQTLKGALRSAEAAVRQAVRRSPSMARAGRSAGVYEMLLP